MTSGLEAAFAASTAAVTASWVLWVQRFGSNAMAAVYPRLRKVDTGRINFVG